MPVSELKVLNNPKELWDDDVPGGTICVSCKGEKLLCGKDKCPILLKFYTKNKIQPAIDSLELEGSSPPSVFVGRFGYPNVYVGPMIPPIHGDTSLMDLPESWFGKSIEEIVEFRFQLVRGKRLVNIHDVESTDRIINYTRELPLAKYSAESEAVFTKKPAGRIVLSDEVQPFGPSAPLKSFEVSSVKTDHKIEKAYTDTDLKAAPAVLGLYEKGIEVSRIQKAFSVGLFGLEKNRRFVPTRWSITAVDSTISQNMVENTKIYPVINEFLVYESVNLDNRWMILMMPTVWSYELIEAWYPKTLWNPKGDQIYMVSSHEFYYGRKTYAEIGGCYYASKLAVNELLNSMKRQAGVVVLRETHPGYIMPVGVWNVRESVRQALKNKPSVFTTLEEALNYVCTKLDIPKQRWIAESNVLRNVIHQRRITDFIK